MFQCVSFLISLLDKDSIVFLNTDTFYAYSQAGSTAGRRACKNVSECLVRFMESKIEILCGLILIAIGFRILLSHLAAQHL